MNEGEVTMADFPRSNGEDDSESQILVKGIQEWRSCEVIGNTPSPRCWFGYCQVKNKFIIFGGYNGKKSANSFLSDVYVLNLDTLEWSEIQTSGQVPSSRYAHSFTLSEDQRKVYMFGGAAGKYYYSSLYILDLETFVWSKPVVNGSTPLQRCAHAVAAIGKYIYIHAGDHGMGQYLDDIFVLNTETLTFSSPKTEGPKPPSRGWHSACAVEKKIYFFGGCNESRKDALLNDIHILDTETMRWEVPDVTSKFPPPRYSHTAIPIGSDIAVIGGKNKDGGNLEVFWYNTELKAWWQPTIEGIQPSNRYAHSTVMYQAKLYIWGGFNGLYTYNDLYVLDIDPQRRSRNLKMPVPQLGLDLKTLLNNSMFSDVTFVVEGKEIFAHRNILAARCEYFRSMFTHQLKEAKMNEVVINGVSFPAFLDFMKYVYTEALDIDVDQAVDLLEVANLYQSDKLKIALSYILENHMDIENCCRLYMHSHHHQAKELENVAFVFITKNFEIVRATKGYQELSEELVQMILKNV